MWFEELMGFKEISPENVRENLYIDNSIIKSKVNDQEYSFGQLEILTLQELRVRCKKHSEYQGQLKLSEKVANVQDIIKDVNNCNSLFQVASQFNLLEMIGPEITPENGIDRYERDHTQGPACAIACGAGTIFRNYFVRIDDQVGQTKSKQIDCLSLIGEALNNSDLNLWEMKNGYALINQNGILNINKQIANLNVEERDNLKSKLKVGIQWNTEVTLSKDKQLVSQIFCSALPVAYSQIEAFYWEEFARVILEATYEATILAGLINYESNHSNKVFLTLVGGGAFGNEQYWILESMEKVLNKYKNCPLNVSVVSYGNSNLELLSFINKYSDL